MNDDGTFDGASVNEIKQVLTKSTAFVLAMILVGTGPEIKGSISGSKKAVHLSKVNKTSQS